MSTTVLLLHQILGAEAPRSFLPYKSLDFSPLFKIRHGSHHPLCKESSRWSQLGSASFPSPTQRVAMTAQAPQPLLHSTCLTGCWRLCLRGFDSSVVLADSLGLHTASWEPILTLTYTLPEPTTHSP